ncbi:hypothetical protein SKC37_01940 [Aquirufa sp. HETE-83D]|uniref:Uncharacterized protein n=2 Tax=Aquirufa esocilacus TaxID=3096513 RepID=A0ABW6DJA7_9BACT
MPKEIRDQIAKENIRIQKDNDNYREEQRKKKEEEIKNRKHKIENCNNFKDNTGNYTGFIIEDVFYYDSKNVYPLRTLVDGTPGNTVAVSFFHLDNDGNQCNIDVEIPTDLVVPNIIVSSEKVKLNFTCTAGQLKSGNIINSISRVD